MTRTRTTLSTLSALFICASAAYAQKDGVHLEGSDIRFNTGLSIHL
ncbi:MAG: hypothetical protein ACI9OU_000341 [Candidatus Promineifilaceae bacterium]|jgi:hypothetical protein